MKTTKKIEGTDFELVTITRGVQESDFNVSDITIEANYGKVIAYHKLEVGQELYEVVGGDSVYNHRYHVLVCYDYPNRAKKSTNYKKDAEMLEAFNCMGHGAITTLIIDRLVTETQHQVDRLVERNKYETENWMKHVYREAEYETIGAEQSEVDDLRAKLDVALDKLKEAKLNELSRELPDFDWASMNTPKARLIIP